ncbi:MAG: BMC domain-containing protein [Verrucomicrobia bacterium]|nr:BMC domain-containing protein [Verrucomicrobiota bacterium]
MNPSLALGLAEIPFVSLAAVVADHMVKAAPVHLLGIETTGNEYLLLRLAGDVAAIESALAIAVQRTRDLGATARVQCLARPEPPSAPSSTFPTPSTPSTAVATNGSPPTSPPPPHPT